MDHHMHHHIAVAKVGTMEVLLQLQPQYVVGSLHLHSVVCTVHHLVKNNVCGVHPVPDIHVQRWTGEGDVGEREKYFLITRDLHCPADWQARAHS